MMIFLSEAKPEYPWLKRIGIRLFNWVMWFPPAAAVTLADDVGSDYQIQVAMLTVFATVMAFITPFMCTAMLGAVWWHMLLLAVGMYLFFGILYHWNERRWSM